MKSKLTLFFVCLSMYAVSQAPGTATIITDTVHYYFNKYYFKSGQTELGKMPYYKVYNSASVKSGTNVTHVGNIFENPDTIIVKGAEAYMMGYRFGQQALPIHFYLHNVDNSNMPLMDPIDSFEVFISSTVPVIIGGNFSKPHKMAGKYAISLRNFSTTDGDTVRLYRTASSTFTAWPDITWGNKYSDGNGRVRDHGQFYKTTNYNAPGFGNGTDYEFFIAPRVQFTLVPGQIWPQQVSNGDTICTYQQITFTNVSSPKFTSPTYNMCEFYRKWSAYAPFAASPVNGGWPADTSISWKFESEDDGVHGHYYLPAGGGSQTIVFYTDSVISPKCTDQNYFSANFKGMAAFGRAPQHSFNQQFTLCVDYCNGNALGLNKQNKTGIVIYPNPAADYLVLNGTGTNTSMEITDPQGQVAFVKNNCTSSERVYLGMLKPGYYVVSITEPDGKTQRLKLLKY